MLKPKNSHSTTMSTVLGVPAAIQDFFNTGLPGALITTIVASLMWRIVAASYPIAFMGNPVVRLTIRLCLILEASGLFSSAWLLADGIKWMLGFQPDEMYLSLSKSSHDDLKMCDSGRDTVGCSINGILEANGILNARFVRPLFYTKAQ